MKPSAYKQFIVWPAGDHRDFGVSVYGRTAQEAADEAAIHLLDWDEPLSEMECFVELADAPFDPFGGAAVRVHVDLSGVDIGGLLALDFEGVN